MPDITMCKDERCPLKEKCFRYTARPDKRQSYFLLDETWEKMIAGDYTNCEYFWK